VFVLAVYLTLVGLPPRLFLLAALDFPDLALICVNFHLVSYYFCSGWPELSIGNEAWILKSSAVG